MQVAEGQKCFPIYTVQLSYKKYSMNVACRRQKIKIAEPYVNLLDVRRPIFNLLEGSITKSSNLVSHLPTLLRKKSKCVVKHLEVQAKVINDSYYFFIKKYYKHKVRNM